MKILIATDLFYTPTNGAVTSIKNLCKELNKRDHAVKLVQDFIEEQKLDWWESLRIVYFPRLSSGDSFKEGNFGKDNRFSGSIEGTDGQCGFDEQRT